MRGHRISAFALRRSPDAYSTPGRTFTCDGRTASPWATAALLGAAAVAFLTERKLVACSESQQQEQEQEQHDGARKDGTRFATAKWRVYTDRAREMVRFVSHLRTHTQYTTPSLPHPTCHIPIPYRIHRDRSTKLTHSVAYACPGPTFTSVHDEPEITINSTTRVRSRRH